MANRYEVIIDGKDQSKAAFESVKGSLRDMEAYSKRVVGGLASLAAVGTFAGMADQIKLVRAQISNISDENIKYASSLKDIERISQTVQTDLIATSAAYTRNAFALKEYNATQQQVAALTETVALNLKLSGATAEETASVLAQASQALGSGFLQGDEFKSLAEASPRLMKQLADSIGVPVGQLKAMAKEGQITTDVLLKAFTDEKILEGLRKQSESLRTVSGSVKVFKNEIIQSLGNFDEALGASSGLAKLIDQLTKGIQVASGRPPAGSYGDLLFKAANNGLEGLINSVGIRSKRQRDEAQANAARGIFGDANPVTSTSPIGPNFNSTVVAQDVDKIHQKQEEQARKAAASIKESVRAANDFVESLKKEAEQIGLTNGEQTRYEASLLNLTNAQKESVNASITKIEAYEREKKALADMEEFTRLLQESDERALDAEIARYDEEQQRIDAATKSYEEFYNNLIEQNEQLNIDLIRSDKARAKAQLEIENARAIERIQGLMLEQDQVNELLDEQAKNYDLQLRKIEQSTSGIGNLSKELGREFTSAFEDAVLASGNFGDALDGLGRDLERLAQQSVTNPLFRGIQSLFEENVGSFIPGLFANAKGGVYSGSGISQYSERIVNSPTVFPFAKGIGLMGEAGPEAIMPLRRTADGALGIKAQGMGTNVTVNIIGASSTPKVSQTTDDNGNTNIDVMFEKVESYLGARVAKGQGSLAEVLGSNFGLSRGFGAQG